MDIVKIVTGAYGDDDEPPSKQMQLLLERKKQEDKVKAVSHWKLLRESMQSTVEAVTKADVKDLVISHGIHHLRKLNHQNQLTSVLFKNDTKEYVTTDAKTVSVFLEDGRKKESYKLEEPLDNIVYCRHTKQFVGWISGEDELFLLSSEFEIISQSRVPCKISLACYNHNTSEFITVGPGFLVTWAFRYGARHLIPRKMTKIRFKEDHKFTHWVLEETASRQQKVFMSSNTNVVAFNVYEGKELAYRKDLHERMITALTYFNPLKYLITGALDGTIKVWDNEWFVKMVFVGHTECVNFLSIYPEGPSVMSASHDCTIRVWNLDSCDEMDRASLDAPVNGMAAELGYYTFYTYSNNHVDMWKIQHLFKIFTAVGHRIVSIKQTSHPFHPIRSVITSRDSSIRIVTPPSGDVLTTLLLDPAQVIVDAGYAIEEELLFVALQGGNILKCRTDTNPARVIQEWPCQDPREACNYLLVYEYVPDFKSDAWAAFKRGLATNSLKNASEEGTVTSKNRTILLGGRKDGYICVYNMETGQVDFKIDAHGVKGVLSMIANSKQDQLISAGRDNIIKVWRLYPYAQEALAPLLLFYCKHTPLHMTMLKNNLCVAFQDHSTATYSIVIYNLKDRNLFEHAPDDDHVDSITGLSSCGRMKLYASSSLDGTIRIWDEQNNLIRMLKLKTMPFSVGFCSSRGDLLVGIGLHLYKIPYQAYLPRKYMFRMVSMKFAESIPESCKELDEDFLKKLSKHDVTRLKKSKSSFRYDHFEDILTPEEIEEITREQKLREVAFAEIETRENELKKMVAGDFPVKRKPMATPEIKDEAFKNFMKLYYNKPRLTIPPDEPFPKDALDRHMKGPPPPEHDMFRPEKEPSRFFPPASRAVSASTPQLKSDKPGKDPWKTPSSFLKRELPPIARSEGPIKISSPLKEPSPAGSKMASQMPGKELTPVPPIPSASPAKEPTPPPMKEPTPPAQEPSPIKEPSPPARDPTPASIKEPSPAPKEITPPASKEPTQESLKDSQSPAELAKEHTPVPSKGSQSPVKSASSAHSRVPSREPSNASSPLQAAYPPIKADGFVPNSVMAKILWPPPAPDPREEDQWKPPELTPKQLAEIKGIPYEEPPPEEVAEPSPEPMIFDYEDDPEEHEAEESPVPSVIPTPSPPPVRSKEVKFNKQDTVHVIGHTPSPPPGPPKGPSLMDKFQSMLAKPASPVDDDDSTITTTPRSPRELDTEKPAPAPATAPAKEAKPPVKPAPPKPKPLLKPFLPAQRPKPPSPPHQKEPPPQPKVKVAPPPAPRSPSPPPPRQATPVPTFISQFSGSDWFDKYFPSLENMPKPWTTDNFAIMVSRLLRIAEYPHKVKISDALAMLFTQEDVSEVTGQNVGRTIIAVLNGKEPPSCLVEIQKSFIVSALNALLKIGVKDKEFITELMVQFLDGDKEVRGTCMETLSSCGLQDPHKHFIKELDSWDIWNVEEDDRKSDLRKMCQQWLDRWMTSYKLHLTDAIERMQKGQSIHGKLRPDSRKRASPVPGKSSMRKSIGGIDSIPENQEVSGGHEGSEFMPRIPGDDRRRSMTVTFEKPPDMAIVETANYMDALNYFCDMMMEKALESLKKGGRRAQGSQENVIQAKNTVLVLPKMPRKPALVRLGETHTSQCRPHRETSLHVDYRQLAATNRGHQPAPGELSGFAPCINLPMKTLYINPFPSHIDEYDTRFQEPILITLKSAQKYFVHAQSVVPSLDEPSVPPAH